MKGKIVSFILGLAAAVIVFFFISNGVSSSYDSERRGFQDEIENLNVEIGVLNVRRAAQAELTKELVQSDSLKSLEIANLRKVKSKKVNEVVDLPKNEAEILFTELTALQI